ncbi:MAG: glycosyltransferase family 4 protein [Bacteroidales bacterium]|nr:glycosyltransferase family 4 protein [Bacteroidales bacterium]
MVLDKVFPPDERVEKEIESLNSAGYEVAIATLKFNQQLPDEEQKEGYRIYRRIISKFTYKTSVGILKFPFYFRFWKKYLDTIFQAEKNIRVIHIHDLPLAKLGIYYKRKRKVKFILDLHENWPALLATSHHTNTPLGKLLSSNRQWIEYEKKMIGEADSIIAVADEMKQRILPYAGNNITVVENAISLKRINISTKPKIEDNYLDLIYTGGINYHRGVQIVIQALPRIIEKIPNIRFHVVGSGAYMERIMTLTQETGVGDYVTFHGWKSQQEVYELINQSDLAVIPHLKSVQTDNSSPNKLYQYMYIEKPILASNCKSIERVINKVGCGLIYADQSPEDLANKIIEMNSKDMKTMAKKGKNAVLNKYNWEHEQKKLIGLYNDIVNN